MHSYCKICKSKLNYREEITSDEVFRSIPIFYCPVCKQDVKQADTLSFEELIEDRVKKLEEKTKNIKI